MATEVKRCVPLVVCGQKVSPKFMQQLADVHIAPGCGEVQACPAPSVTDIWIKATFEKPFGIIEVSVDACL